MLDGTENKSECHLTRQRVREYVRGSNAIGCRMNDNQMTGIFDEFGDPIPFFQRWESLDPDIQFRAEIKKEQGCAKEILASRKRWICRLDE